MNRPPHAVTIAALCALLPVPSVAQVRGSERGTVSQVIDGTTISLDYSRPVARGRTPFGPGGVVRWGQRWTPGANWATTIETDRDIQVNGLPLPKGKYSIWMVPDQAEWQVILSRESRAFHTRPQLTRPQRCSSGSHRSRAATWRRSRGTSR